MKVQYNISSSTNSFGRVSTMFLTPPPNETQSYLKQYNQQMYDWELKLKGFENTWSKKDIFSELRSRRFQIKKHEDSKYLAFIQMKIEDPDITPEYLDL